MTREKVKIFIVTNNQYMINQNGKFNIELNLRNFKFVSQDRDQWRIHMFLGLDFVFFKVHPYTRNRTNCPILLYLQHFYWSAFLLFPSTLIVRAFVSLGYHVLISPCKNCWYVEETRQSSRKNEPFDVIKGRESGKGNPLKWDGSIDVTRLILSGTF